MRAQIITEFGAPSVFQSADIAKPKAGPGHVVIQVKATSVNPIDCKIRAGLVKAIAPPFPAVLHCDVAGIIAEVGHGVDHLKIGDQVYACAGGVKGQGGALAEFMLADAACVAKKPHNLSFAEAAAMPLVTITAWTALFLRMHLKPRQSILIHGGAGGVGHIAVQLAHWAGAHVAATVGSEEDFELARRLGAKEIANFRTEQVPDYVERITAGKGFEAVFDTVGGANLPLSLQAAALNGTVATIAARGSHDLTPMHTKGLTLHAVFMLIPLIHRADLNHQRRILEQAAGLVEEGRLTPLIDPHTFSLGQVAQAHELLESGNAKGKIVLHV